MNNMIFYRKLPIPKEIKEQFPVTPDVLRTRKKRIKELESIFSGKSDRLILVIGPCSADNEDSVLDYIYRLRTVAEKVKEKIIVKVEKIKNLPADSTINLFYNNLQDYSGIESTEPTLREDSSVVCSLDNLRGANVITARYEGKLEEVKVLNDIVTTASEIITNKDSIINQNSIILNKTREAYDQKLTELNKQIEKEARRKRIATYGGAVLIGVLGGIILFGR